MTPINHPFRRHALAIALALASGATNAATINVTGDCTLVNAINNANSDTDTDGAGACPAGSGADVLNLKPNTTYTLTKVDNTINGPNGLPLVSSTMTINGNGATIQRSTEADTPYFRLLEVASTGNLTLNKLTLTGGNSSAEGGVLNQGSITLSNSAITSNVGGEIGGIRNTGHMSLINSSVMDNYAYNGGGIENIGDMIVTNSTISGNSMAYGALASAITNSGNMELTNCTISYNYFWSVNAISNSGSMSLTNCSISKNTTMLGVTIANSGSITLTNSTIADNGMYSYRAPGIVGGYINMTNSLIANDKDEWYNEGSSDCSGDIVILQGINLIEDGSCGAPLSGDPKLRPLLDNGGLTFTHALHGNSPALAAADSAFCTNTDQRNVKRPPKNKAACDLGAFERKPVISTSVAPLVSFFDTAAASGGIVGVNNFDERIALRNQLLTAGDYKQRNLAIQACSQLTRTLGYIDADNSPETGDYVTGSAAQALADEINALKTSWSCQ